MTRFYWESNFSCQAHQFLSWRFFNGSTTLVVLGLLLVEFSRSHSDTPHLIELLRTRDRPNAQHTVYTRDRHPCTRRDSNPRYQQASGSRHTPLTARSLRSACSYIAMFALCLTRHIFSLFFCRRDKLRSSHVFPLFHSGFNSFVFRPLLVSILAQFVLKITNSVHKHTASYFLIKNKPLVSGADCMFGYSILGF